MRGADACSPGAVRSGEPGLTEEGTVTVLESNGTIRWNFSFPEDLVWTASLAAGFR